MDPSLRSARAIHDRINKMQAECLKRFQSLLELAMINSSDRTSTAATQLQMQTETTALIRTFEEIPTLIRQLQELWLRGPLNTLGDSKAKQSTDETANAVAEALRMLTGMQRNQQAQQEQGQAPPTG
ncbi:hypothetical protein CLAFUW4_05958 [Fulvia fulva]|uniref:Uncharacterized protein n=1 Tax=Passalora fulva TaxID=5499 RepID=A0A9Q8LI07_PASFU|nr:uncharacterized protein CLAFUR5_06102 [Fulvia fulva]KAK4624057.1 hypothetical protein CLAFUR4_05963 [Fulvia fulva]KAK4625659.1 hypothetical protein CLAFUR0_05965 [Fulvia fulva]UJO17855.1 hypothetical protein CLAFUR5_06102 [Fulvia fulva]WPV14485.1 hypothetical protein CLAFUW4_05958 [Fulvia fulva]WPV29500.1 hypothetical protein CLAFUW7_05956 [Fulvia fulva]